MACECFSQCISWCTGVYEMGHPWKNYRNVNLHPLCLQRSSYGAMVAHFAQFLNDLRNLQQIL